METPEYQRMREAEEQHWWYAGLHDLVIRWTQREAARLPHPLDILDAGCGTGRLAQLLQPFGNVAACDRHPLALAATTRRGVQRVFPCDLMTAALEAETYDVITCMDVLYHRAVTATSTVLQNLQRALKPGGLLLVQVPAFECLRGAHDVAVHTRRRFRRRELAHLLHSAGLQLEFSSYRLPLCFVPALLWRQASRHRLAREPDGSDIARPCPAGLNHWLLRLLQRENRLLLAGWRLPFGTSLFASARKRPHPGR
jgi:SAM-dependent methyltransferase